MADHVPADVVQGSTPSCDGDDAVAPKHPTLSQALANELKRFHDLWDKASDISDQRDALARISQANRLAVKQHEHTTNLNLQVINLDELDSLDDCSEWFRLEKIASKHFPELYRLTRRLMGVWEEMITLEEAIKSKFAAELMDNAEVGEVKRFEAEVEDLHWARNVILEGCRAVLAAGGAAYTSS
ncbi:unnamed protein product [Aureobasidium uvarum]|uniref:Uncharacterized protein n=1 Tax=Aureobasidium uvarum TaxID=2773716 RepID=A0A9N8KKF6_9PEZI|nr:unnamed protein product [Aureobasidium uvarum]